MRKPHTPCAHSLTIYAWVRKLMARTDPPLNAREMADVMNRHPEVPKPRRHRDTKQPKWWTKIDLHSLRARVKRNAVIGPPTTKGETPMSQAHEVKPSHMDPDPAKRHPGFIHVCQECYEKHHKDNDTAHPVHERFLAGKQCEQAGCTNILTVNPQGY